MRTHRVGAVEGTTRDTIGFRIAMDAEGEMARPNVTTSSTAGESRWTRQRTMSLTWP